MTASAPSAPRWGKVERLKNTKTNFTLARTSWDRPAPTLVIAGQKPDGLSGAIQPELDRKFTVPELKRLFGLPDDFILTGTIEEAVQCICNMVPPLLSRRSRTEFTTACLGHCVNWTIDGQFFPRSREHEDRVIVVKSAVQHGLQHVVDDPFVVMRDRLHIDSLNSARSTRIQIRLFSEMVDKGFLQARRRRQKNDGVEMQAVIAGKQRRQ
jgi:hypothetical protein